MKKSNNLKKIEAFKDISMSESEGSDPCSHNSSNLKDCEENSINSDQILQSKYPKLKNIQPKAVPFKNIQNPQNSRKIEHSFSNLTIKDSKNSVERPQTSYKGKENVRFQPVYTESYNHFLITNKFFNYKDKNFITVPKKTDIVAKFQNLKKGWEKTKFLKNNGQTGKEGRKLNLAQRINDDKPEEMFYRYVPKSGLY